MDAETNLIVVLSLHTDFHSIIMSVSNAVLLEALKRAQRSQNSDLSFQPFHLQTDFLGDSLNLLIIL